MYNHLIFSQFGILFFSIFFSLLYNLFMNKRIEIKAIFILMICKTRLIISLLHKQLLYYSLLLGRNSFHFILREKLEKNSVINNQNLRKNYFNKDIFAEYQTTRNAVFFSPFIPLKRKISLISQKLNSSAYKRIKSIKL